MNSAPVQQAAPRTASTPGRGQRVLTLFADILRHLGCDYLQGYLIARPGPAFVDPV